jgi:APA family basic amino acid/polyamine antiporter
MPSPNPPKPQQIGLGLAVAIGLASMLGAGVFAVFHEAAALTMKYSDRWALLIAIGLAGLVASLNAASVYHLARKVPRAGGVYAYSRVYVNNTTSFAAGFSFIFGKIGSISAIGLVFGIYVWPDQPVLAASLAIAVLTAINLLGINRTAQVALVLSITTVTFLVATLAWGFAQDFLAGQAVSAGAGTGAGTGTGTGASNAATEGFPPGLIYQHTHIHGGSTSSLATIISGGGIVAILSAAAIIFFAFAGYARVATLGDEVRDPQRNIPRAIVIALGAVLVLYFALGFVLQQTLAFGLMTAKAPFVTFWQLSTASLGWSPQLMQTIVIVVAAAASLGSILALLAGVSRTAATMAEDHELVGLFAKRNKKGAPWLAEVVIAAGAIGFAQLGHLDWSIGFSSLSVLLYYAIGHVAALRQLKVEKTSRNAHAVRATTAWLGVLLCGALLLVVPGPAVWLSTLILAAALFVRRVTRPRS